MSRIFITGSSDGIGQLAARSLIAQGHRVVLHARNDQRAREAIQGCPGAETVLVADLSSIAETKKLAQDANKLGRFDAVIHNAGTGYRQSERKTADGISALFTINSLAPYILTALMERPQRLIYVSSGLHSSGDGSLKDLPWTSGRSWDGFQAYCDSKLHNVILAFATARLWPDVTSNAINPGWVATKMGGAGAPDDMQKAFETQVWLATKNQEGLTGNYFKYMQKCPVHQVAADVKKQEEFLNICQQLSGVPFPR